MTPKIQFMLSTPPTNDERSRNATGGRDPAHELYEHAAELLTTAHALEAATHEPGAVVAVSPTLACLEASLVALAGATERLRRHTLERLTEPVLATENLRAHRSEVALHLERLAGVLEQGSLACTQARDSIEPVVTELTAI
jgi:hypothetical protein